MKKFSLLEIVLIVLLFVLLIATSPGCIASTIRTTDKHMYPDCMFPTRDGSDDPIYQCEKSEEEKEKK
jgi:hypothetical protein